MALLPDADRAEGVGFFNNHVFRLVAPLDNLTKAQIRAAFDAIDQWADDNAAAMNAAIPQPARGRLTASQKAYMLQLVVERRYRRS